MQFFGQGRVAHGRPAHAAALKVWRSAVGEAGRVAMEAAGRALLSGPVAVEVVFFLERPLVHHRGRRRSHPVRGDAPTLNATLPDLDKLVRALLDSLTGVVWVDDGQVAQVAAVKRYAAPDPLGARVAVWALADGPPAVVTLDLDLDEEGDA
ncbi:MAG: RusA family crossover junction endodeoxyribonuclease [Solirubrobacteraceae bacterium]